MSMRRQRIDATVVGGGVVGSACALALARSGLQVALVEASPPPRWSANARDLRVYALGIDNAAFLDTLGIWNEVRARRAQPYRRMRVWDAAGDGELTFDADALGRPELGWIVEHGLLAERLWSALQDAGVDVRVPATLLACEQRDDGVELVLDDGSRIASRIAIAADGAESTLRALAGIDADTHAYPQRAIVAYVDTAAPHEDTAWQRFLPGGPLAFLPCTSGASSIVWTLPEDDARRMLDLDDAAFSQALARAFDARLGAVAVSSPRAAFPLRRQLAGSFVQGRVLLVGDAAHVVHPLAGQGVNLGLRDVQALQLACEGARRRGVAFDAPHRLRRWARARRSEGALAAHAFDAINRAFSNDALLSALLRGPALGVASRLPPLADLLWRRASGA